jgi:uracil-DNA glycosylase
MSKAEQYKSLVEKRKACSLCSRLCNPVMVANGQFDSNHIGPWSLWQANLNAELVVIGQDWGDIAYFTKWEGRDQPTGNPTNENLVKLLNVIGVVIGKPRDHQNQVVFFTNLILCLKTGGLQGPIDDKWFANCSRAFCKPLMEIIVPRVIIALGKKTSESILDAYDIPYSRGSAFSRMLKQSPYHLTHSTVLFPVYHCGAGGVNRNRSMSEQEEDWLKVNQWLRNNG